MSEQNIPHSPPPAPAAFPAPCADSPLPTDLPEGWLRIESMDMDAQGVAHRPDGKVVFIDGALPGELVSAQTKHKVSEILHLLGNDNTRLTALADNMLRFVMDIYSDELNYLHDKKNNRRPF